jgi:hypothetical protein
MPKSLTDDGDVLERGTWPTMQAYISKYEILWQMHVEPLRDPGSIDLRDGIDPDFELFAMNHVAHWLVVFSGACAGRRSSFLSS